MPAVPTDKQAGKTPMPVRVGDFTFAQLDYVADMIARSSFFPKIKNKADAFALVMLCHADGRHPLSAVREFHFYLGEPTLKAEAALARFFDRGGEMRVDHCDITGFKGEFKSKGIPTWIPVEFGPKDAELAGLLGKDNYKHYAPDMYWARGVTRGIRRSDPGAMLGYRTTEEADDIHWQREQGIIIDAEEIPAALPDTGGKRVSFKDGLKGKAVEPAPASTTPEPEPTTTPEPPTTPPASGPTVEPEVPQTQEPEWMTRELPESMTHDEFGTAAAEILKAKGWGRAKLSVAATRVFGNEFKTLNQLEGADRVAVIAELRKMAKGG